MQDHPEVSTDYMLRRALSLLLTDLRQWRQPLQSVEFGVQSGHASGAAEGPILTDLLLLFNIWSAGRSFAEDNQEGIAVPSVWAREYEIVRPQDLNGPVDWPKTLEHLQKGGQGFVVYRVSRKSAEHQAHFIATVLGEFIAHCEVVTLRIMSAVGQAPPYVLQLLGEVEAARARAEKILEEHLSPYRDSWISSMERAQTALQQVLVEVFARPEDLYGVYQSAFPLHTPRGTFTSNVVRALAKWRERYLSCEVWFSGDNVFRYTRSGSVADLYEIWVFFELCSAFRRAGLEKVVQVSFLQRRQQKPQFRWGDCAYIYFDFRTGSLRETDLTSMPITDEGISVALPGVYVEWFIRNRKNYRKSVCLDVKYANWESREILKVMGYMTNFGVENGVLVIRDHVPQSTVGWTEVIPGLFQIPCPLGSTFWILSLPPIPEKEAHNQDIIDRFVENVFGAGSLHFSEVRP